MTKSITVADYLHEALDAQRKKDDEGTKESWTEFFCRTYGIRYRPHGLTRRTNGRVGASTEDKKGLKMQKMSHRNRIRNMKIENFMDIKNFRAIIRGSAEKHGWTYYVVLHIIKRARWVRDGVVKIVEKDGVATPVPQILMSVDVIESNLPMPINVYNPIFKFVRNDKENPLDPKKASYYGIPTALEYFTLPENVENTLNHREPVGDHFTSAGILKWFDTMAQADMFLLMLADQIKVLLDDLQVFVEKNKEYFDWESIESIGVTRQEIKRATIAKEFGVSSLLAPDIDNPEQKG